MKYGLPQIFLPIQGLIVLFDIIVIVLPVMKGEDPNVLAISSFAISFMSLILCESGRRYSRSAFLKIYLFLSLVGLLLSVACAVQSDIFLLELMSLGLSKALLYNIVVFKHHCSILVKLVTRFFVVGFHICSGEKQRIQQIIDGARSFLEVAVQVFGASTTLSLVHNMSPSKRTS